MPWSDNTDREQRKYREDRRFKAFERSQLASTEDEEQGPSPLRELRPNPDPAYLNSSSQKGRCSTSLLYLRAPISVILPGHHASTF